MTWRENKESVGQIASCKLGLKALTNHILDVPNKVEPLYSNSWEAAMEEINTRNSN